MSNVARAAACQDEPAGTAPAKATVDVAATASLHDPPFKAGTATGQIVSAS